MLYNLFGDKLFMRIFYLFEVKDDVLKKYKNNYEELFLMLGKIKNLREENLSYAYEIYDSLINLLDRDEFNLFIRHFNISNENYICYNYTHTINDFYNDEITKLKIYNSFIKINTNKNNPIFFNDLCKIRNIFVCDFDNYDYFILNQDILSNY